MLVSQVMLYKRVNKEAEEGGVAWKIKPCRNY